MGLILLSDISKIDKIKWSEFVSDHPNGNIFQTPEMVSVYMLTKNYEPMVVACLDPNNQIAGILVAVIQKEFEGVMGKISSRSIIWGGPLIKDNSIDVLYLILSEYIFLAKGKVIYTQIRNLHDQTDFKVTFKNLGFRFEDHLNIHINLSKTEENLWKELHANRKKNIRKVKNDRGLVKEIKEIPEFRQACKILTEVYNKVNLPLAGESLFINANEILGKNNFFRAFGFYFENVLIGTRFVLCYKSTITDWYGGSLTKFNDKYPNDIIPWEIIIWGKQNNYTLFDFGGAGKPNEHYGVRDYKAKFGGEFVNFGRFEKVHNPWLFSLAKTGFRIWQKLKI